MIEKISDLKSKTNSKEVKELCENTLAVISSAIYNGVTPEAKYEIERVAISNLFESLSKYKKVEGISEWLTNHKRLFTVKNLGIRDAINSLNETEELKEVLEGFRTALNKGIHEARLYEQFITALSPFGYFPTVGNAIKAVEDRVNTYKSDVNILKILETMKETRSNYLVPLIEDVINNYLSNKNQQTKHQLTETLMKFTYDSFVRDIASLLTLDATELQLEYANAECDIDKVYSPVLYIGENEAVFSVNKVYYIKKGNNISRLPESEVAKLDTEYKALCELLSNPNIIASKKGITIYDDNATAVINEKKVSINGNEISKEDFEKGVAMSEWAGNRGFYQLIEFINSNYNEIAEIDFVKRVYLKENANFGADVFKLRDNVFITTHNPELGKSTFYRNVNPMQAKNIMMEHLRFDVTSLYSNLLPDEEKINAQINETKNSYNEYIKDLQEKIEKFQNSTFGVEVNEQVVDALVSELNEVKSEYKDYLNHVEKYMRASESIDEQITVDINVDGKKYTVPIPQEATGDNGNIQQDAEIETGTIVGDEVIDEPASAVTFDDDQTELLGDTPSIETDEIDLGSDELEVQADEAEAEAEEEKEEEESDVEDDGEDIQIEDEVDIEDEDKTDLENEDEEDEIKIEDEEETKEQPLESSEGEGLEEAGEGEQKPKKKKVFLKKKAVTESVKKKINKLDEKVSDSNRDKVINYYVNILFKDSHILNSDRHKEALGKYFNYTKEDFANLSDQELDFIWNTVNKLDESVKPLNEAQIGDTVMYDKQKGSVIGQTGDGDLIVQVQYSTHKANPKDVKVLGAKVETLKPPFKFSKETQKLLFEQFVKCGIYMNNVPIKTSDCYVMYSDWQNAKLEEQINVIVEGQNNLLPKAQIKVFEDANEFANLDNYIEGVEIDEVTEEPISSVRINVIDYTDAIGDAEPVRIIRGGDGEEPTVDTVPKATLRTLSV